jgi:hypothetical protein
MVAILGLTHGGEKPGFFLDTSLANQYLSQKPGFFGVTFESKQVGRFSTRFLSQSDVYFHRLI